MTTLPPSLMPDEWYHSSKDPGVIDEFDPDKDPYAQDREGNPKHWNSHLGTHFTSRHDTAHHIGFTHGGRIYHARLDMKNPKHYESENDLDHEALEYHRSQFPHDRELRLDHVTRDLQGNVKSRTPWGAEETLTQHSEAREMAHHFRDHLESQGHDGITYGNEYEEPRGHLCAIAFHPEQIHVTEHHLHQLACSEDGRHCEDCGSPTDTALCHQCGHTSRLSSRTASEDYRMQHSAPGPDFGAPLHDLTQDGMYPDDVYTHPHHYAYEPSDHRSWRKASDLRGKPDAMVRIYRSLPPEHAHEGIHPGDWVSIDRGYAKQHGKHPTDSKQDWPVISARVPAKHVYTNGDSLSEWGYHGPETVGATGKPLYTGPTQHFTFSGGGTGPRGENKVRVNAWDPDGNYAGHVEAEGDGTVLEHHVEPQHAHTDLAERLLKAHQAMPPGQLWGDININRTAASEPYLSNPYHSGDDFHHTWFHGTTSSYNPERARGGRPLDSPNHYLDEDFAGPGRGHSGPQMNKLLGTHFSALRSVAKGFAKDWSDSDVFHAGLRMKNPAYFPDEHVLDRHIFRHVMEHHPEFANDEKFASEQRWQGGSSPRNLAERDRQMGDDHPRRRDLDQAMGSMLRWHPGQRDFAKSFVDRLRSEGHDGIVYGNLVEGPKFHHCAIALHPDDIDVQHIAHLPESRRDPTRQTYSITPPERTADDALDEPEEKLRGIQEMHHGSPERYDHQHASRTNLDHGPWKPYAGTHILTPHKEASKPGLYWRVHPNDRPFSPEDASSREWATSREPDLGYSAMHRPEDLVGYFSPDDRHGIRSDAHVVQFSGHEVGKGLDGEPLVVPDMKHIKRMSWDDLEDHVGHDIVKDINQRNGWGDTHNDEEEWDFQRQAARKKKPVRRDPRTGIELCHKTVGGHRDACRFLLGHTQDCDIDWNAVYPDEDGDADDSGMSTTSALGDLSDQQRQDLADHFAAHHPHLDASNGMADWLHRADHQMVGDRAMGPRRGQPSLLGMDHSHPASIDPYVASWERTAGANGPDYDNLTFDDLESFGWPHTEGTRLLRAHHPEHGMVGALYYDDRPNYLRIGRIRTNDEHQRRGVATQMMRELESRYPGKPIQHGMRSDQGHAWAESVYGTPIPENLREKQNWTINGHEAVLDEAKEHWYGDGSMDIAGAAGHLTDAKGWSNSLGYNNDPMYRTHARDLMEAAQPIDKPLWHGHGNNHNLRVGDVIDVPLKATSTDYKTAQSFAWGGHDHEDPHGWTMMHFAPGAHGVTIPENGEGEHVITGRYEVTHVPDEHNVHLRYHSPLPIVKDSGLHGELPEDLRFRYQNLNDKHYIVGHIPHPETPGDRKQIGHLALDGAFEDTEHPVSSVQVHPAYRRRGVAGAIWHAAKEMGFHPIHTPDDQTEDGAAWAEKVAAVRNVSDTLSDGDGITEGIMIAIVPPDEMAGRIAIEDGEDPAQLHITLAYLGQTGDYDQQQLDGLKEVVAAWAEAHEPLTATLQGAGTFVKATEDGQHVLWASVDAPGLERMHVSLVDWLEHRGYSPSRSHVFVPHMTLSYEKHHVRFLPKIERESWTVEEVWVCIAGRWESVTLGSEEVTHERTAGRGKPRRDQPVAGAGGPAPDSVGGDPGPVGDGQGAPRSLTLHPKVEKEISRLHPQVQRKISDTMDRLAAGDPSLETHALTLKLKGWYSTKVDRGHRIIHQPDGQGGIYVGYAGLHDYDKAINRLIDG